jgi:S-adenosylmethionine:tRNA ribosyltransferase-isomerase
MMKTSDFDYQLPPERIAQTPAEPRDSSRLLVLHRDGGHIEHRLFGDIGDYLQVGDMLVANNSRVIPARLLGRKATGGQVEILLLEQINATTWKALVKGKHMRPGTTVNLVQHAGEPAGVQATVLAELDGAQRLVSFSPALDGALDAIGETPLPPYIHAPLRDPERYQTVYARPSGSAAAPTAGLHFTPELLLALRDAGVGFETVTLHVGLDTFKPVSADAVADHTIHSESIELSVAAAERINQAKLAGGRIVAVGTTAVRTLETAAWRAAGVTGSLRTVSALQSPPACPWKPVAATNGRTDLYIYPGYQYRVVDCMLTNFHLPRSSLLMLVAAFAGYELMMHAYHVAIAAAYRFYSFGDAMLIV